MNLSMHINISPKTHKNTKILKTYLYFVKLNSIPQEPCFRKHELKSEKDMWGGRVEGDKQIMTVCPCMEEKQGQLIEKVPN